MAGFAILTAVCARIAIPMVPVPMTLQTWAVLLAGAATGPVRGVSAVALYLVAGLAGLPVLADGASGLAPFTGPTAGYLIAFLPAAGLAGWLCVKGRLARSPAAVGWMVALHLLILAVGGVWLALNIGAGPALEHGVLPFLPGAVLKSVLVVAAAYGLSRLKWFRRA
ncbi:biotin transporter BioY [Brevundimonas sp. Root1423]|uniref:biotin transporter BioY n=1 Tax=Brevundimonas sp. Root1423 TaxID=1736462 RepID=UPI00138EFBAD|nr:biotin transporter BioY [Brevundimonas sp. Root1423]